MNLQSILPAVLVVGGTGLLFGCLLAFASVIFKIVRDNRIDQIIEVLPGANCGACGYAGCSAYAEAVVSGGAPLNACSVGKDAVAQQIGAIMGKDAGAVEKKIAKVLCGGTCNVTTSKYDYHGIQSCIAAAKLGGGPKTCPNGCLGFGTCADVCQFDAISVIDGVAVIDEDKCTACGMCIEKCPKNIIQFVPKAKPFVLCDNTEPGAQVNKYCKSGCIGCKICEKNCPVGAITVANNIASINYDLCIDCGVCAEKCPKHVIVSAKEPEHAIQ